MSRKVSFKFQNKDFNHSINERQELSLNRIKKLSVFISLSLAFAFALLNVISFLPRNLKKEVQTNPLPQPVPHVVPLLVNLKSKEGPQLARVNIYINLNKPSAPLSVLSQNHKLEQKLLFLLSGQPVSKLESKDFQNQIQSQLNVFLDEHSIEELKIQTTMLN